MDGAFSRTPRKPPAILGYHRSLHSRALSNLLPTAPLSYFCKTDQRHIRHSFKSLCDHRMEMLKEQRAHKRHGDCDWATGHFAGYGDGVDCGSRNKTTRQSSRQGLCFRQCTARFASQFTETSSQPMMAHPFCVGGIRRHRQEGLPGVEGIPFCQARLSLSRTPLLLGFRVVEAPGCPGRGVLCFGMAAGKRHSHMNRCQHPDIELSLKSMACGTTSQATESRARWWQLCGFGRPGMALPRSSRAVAMP